MTNQQSGLEQLATRSTTNQGSGVTWRLLVFSIVVFLVLVVSYIGLEFGYKTFLNNQIDSIKAQAEQLVSGVQGEEQEAVIDFYSRLANIQSLLTEHVYTSRFLRLLEANTDKGVFFTNADVKVETGEAVMEGSALSYAELARQLEAFKELEGVEDVELAGAQTADNGRVSFEIQFRLDRNIFDK